MPKKDTKALSGSAEHVLREFFYDVLAWHTSHAATIPPEAKTQLDAILIKGINEYAAIVSDPRRLRESFPGKKDPPDWRAAIEKGLAKAKGEGRLEWSAASPLPLFDRQPITNTTVAYFITDHIPLKLAQAQIYAKWWLAEEQGLCSPEVITHHFSTPGQSIQFNKRTGKFVPFPRPR